MTEPYDLEGYHCLMIAILMGVNAKEARILYEYGLNNPVSQKILKKKHPKIMRMYDEILKSRYVKSLSIRAKKNISPGIR